MSEESKNKTSDRQEAGFFSRWSRLKKQQKEQETAGLESAGLVTAERDKAERDTAGPNTAGLNTAEQEVSDLNDPSLMSQGNAPESTLAPEDETPPVLTDVDMPDVSNLNGESDYSGFLSPGVSDELRKLALRKLFNSDFFHIRDGLDDYDEEYTHFEKLGDIITADMRFQMEREAKAKLQQELDAEGKPEPENPEAGSPEAESPEPENHSRDDTDIEEDDEDIFEDEIAEDDEELFEEPEAILAAKDEKAQTEAAEIRLQSDVDKKSKSENRV